MNKYDQSWRQINKPSRFKLARLKLWLFMLKFERATHIGSNRCLELSLDAKICRIKYQVLRMQVAREIF